MQRSSSRFGTGGVKSRKGKVLARSADQSGMDSGEDLIERELMLSRFNRLIGEVRRGEISRNNFHPWELDLLNDIEHCNLGRRKLEAVLVRYQKAVSRQLEKGPGPPMKLSEYLQPRSTRRPTTV